MKKALIHRTADIGKNTTIGDNTTIWHYVQIRENVKIGSNCTIGKNVYIDLETTIGDKCKIQNNASIYHKTILEDGVFIGPNVIITNDKTPRAIKGNGELRPDNEWHAGTVIVRYGASIGAGCIILPDVMIGKFAMVGAGSVITQDVPDFALVYGNPAKVYGKVDETGKVTERFKNV